jgi:glycopeptide antibiotics resistance protein
VLAESVGALAGALLWMLAGDRLSEFATEGWRQLGSPALFLLGTYSILWTLWQWLPFDFTLRLAELAHKYRAGLLTLLPHSGADADALLTLRSAARQWLLACPIGVAAWLLTRSLRWRRADAAILIGCGFTLGVYGAGLLTESGSIDVAAIGAAGLGAASGAWWAERAAGPRDRVIAFAAIAALLIDQWAPFRLSSEPQPFTMLPLLSYLRAAAPAAISEVLLKLQLGFAAAFAAGGFRAPTQFRWSNLLRWIAGFAIVEFGQVFLSGRFADVTDVVLLSSGAAMGLVVRGLFHRERAAYSRRPEHGRPRTHVRDPA